MSLRDRVAEGTPLRVGELARYIGYSYSQVRKWIEAGELQTVTPPVSGAERRVPVDEAKRLAKALRLL